MRSGSTGRLRQAICTERRSLSRSKGTRRPLRLITTSSRNCTRSKVVKRKLQARQTRRRRMTDESSVGRESFTWVSRLPQLGQRILSLVDRESAYQTFDLVAHARFGLCVLLRPAVRQRVKHFGDQIADLPEFGDAEAARRARRRAKADTRRYGRLLRIIGNAVFVAGDMGAAERELRHLPGQIFAPQIDQHQMRVGAAGDDIQPAVLQGFSQCFAFSTTFLA